MLPPQLIAVMCVCLLLSVVGTHLSHLAFFFTPFDMADNLACTYAALILNDCGSECSAEKLAAVIAASGFQVRPTLPMLYANFLAKKPIGSLIAAAQSAPVAAAAPAAGGAAPAAAAAAPAAAKKEAPKKVEEEEDGEMGFGLFD